MLLDIRLGTSQHTGMGRAHRTQAGGLVYHVLNRANGRAPLFTEPGDYEAFLRVLARKRGQRDLC